MARGFEFRLDPVLRLRRRFEDEQKRIVGERLHELETARQIQRGLEAQMASATDAVRELRKLDGPLDVAEQVRKRQWFEHLLHRKVGQEQRVAELAQALVIARRELAERVKQRKVLEKLRDRKRKEFVERMDRAERLESDEMAARMFNRQSSSDTGAHMC